jgi:hypothetical protein
VRVPELETARSLTRSNEPPTRVVLGSLAAAFASGTILYLAVAKPERASAWSAAWLMFLLGAVILALGDTRPARHPDRERPGDERLVLRTLQGDGRVLPSRCDRPHGNCHLTGALAGIPSIEPSRARSPAGIVGRHRPRSQIASPTIDRTGLITRLPQITRAEHRIAIGQFAGYAGDPPPG